MRRSILVLALTLGALSTGCNSTKTWNCHYICPSTEQSGNATYQDDDQPEAEDKCEAEHSTGCTTGFTCTCTAA